VGALDRNVAAAAADHHCQLGLVVEESGDLGHVHLGVRPGDAADLLVEEGRNLGRLHAHLGDVVGVVERDRHVHARHRRGEQADLSERQAGRLGGMRLDSTASRLGECRRRFGRQVGGGEVEDLLTLDHAQGRRAGGGGEATKLHRGDPCRSESRRIRPRPEWVPVAMPSIRTTLSLALSSLVLLLAGCGSDDSTTTTTTDEEESSAQSSPGKGNAGTNAPAPSGDAVRAEKVSIVEFAYDPDPVRIEEGGKVIWVNRDAAPHTATADDGSFDTGTIAQDKLKSESFKQPGTYTYFCEIHPDMHGTVEVVAAP